MAGADAIKNVGDTLVALLRAHVAPGVVQSANIQVATPDDFKEISDAGEPAITVFLYRIAVDGTTRNKTRRTLPNGNTTRPLLPIAVSYMITPWASEPGGEQFIAGRIVQTFYDYAEIGPAQLQGTSWEPDDSIQLVLQSLPIEDHYRIWDTTKLPYRLSLTYEARVVGIEPTIERATAPVVAAQLGRSHDAS